VNEQVEVLAIGQPPWCALVQLNRPSFVLFEPQSFPNSRALECEVQNDPVIYVGTIVELQGKLESRLLSLVLLSYSL